MRDGVRRIRSSIVGPFLLLALVGLVGLARWDRHWRPCTPLSIENRTIRLPTTQEQVGPNGGRLPARPIDIPEAAAELERAAAAANEARAGLEKAIREIEQSKKELERRQAELKGLSADAEARQKTTQRELQTAQRDLDAKRVEMETAAREAEERVGQARRDLEQLERQRIAAAAQAGVARGLGRGSRLDMQVAADPRRFRSPAIPPVVANEAAVAAAGPRIAGGGGGGRSGPLFSTTAQGDMLQGQAALVEAQGSYALDTSKAAINAQTTRAMSLDNHLRTAETFFEARRINRINREYEAGPRATFEQIVWMAAAGIPPRPTGLQLDRATGDISWPRLLRDPTYADLTSRVQHHFHDRSIRGDSLDFTSAEDCHATFDQLVARMRDNRTRYKSGEYGAARTFVDGLKREYDLPLAE